MMKHTTRTFFIRYLKFGSAGAVGIVVNVSVLFLLHEIFHLDYRIASLIAIESAIINNFILHCRWTWKDSRGLHPREILRMFIKFNASCLGLGILINWTLLVSLTEISGLSPHLSNLVGILVGNLGAVANFLLSNYFIFKRKPVEKPAQDDQEECRKAAGNE